MKTSVNQDSGERVMGRPEIPGYPIDSFLPPLAYPGPDGTAAGVFPPTTLYHATGRDAPLVEIEERGHDPGHQAPRSLIGRHIGRGLTVLDVAAYLFRPGDEPGEAFTSICREFWRDGRQVGLTINDRRGLLMLAGFAIGVFLVPFADGIERWRFFHLGPQREGVAVVVDPLSVDEDEVGFLTNHGFYSLISNPRPAPAEEGGVS